MFLIFAQVAVLASRRPHHRPRQGQGRRRGLVQANGRREPPPLWRVEEEDPRWRGGSETEGDGGARRQGEVEGVEGGDQVWSEEDDDDGRENAAHVVEVAGFVSEQRQRFAVELVGESVSLLNNCANQEPENYLAFLYASYPCVNG